MLRHMRNIHNYVSLSLCVLALAAMDSAQAADRPANRPNIVFIFADDLGYGDIGWYGAQDIKTPHIDKYNKSFGISPFKL